MVCLLCLYSDSLIREKMGFRGTDHGFERDAQIFELTSFYLG